MTNSAALLGGTLTLTNLGTFNASNATVYLFGVFDNTNTTVSVNALGGPSKISFPCDSPIMRSAYSRAKSI